MESTCEKPLPHALTTFDRRLRLGVLFLILASAALEAGQIASGCLCT